MKEVPPRTSSRIPSVGGPVVQEEGLPVWIHRTPSKSGSRSRVSSTPVSVSVVRFEMSLSVGRVTTGNHWTWVDTGGEYTKSLRKKQSRRPEQI